MSLPIRSRYKLSLDSVKELSTIFTMSYRIIHFRSFAYSFQLSTIFSMIGPNFSVRFLSWKLWLYLAHLLLGILNTDSNMSESIEPCHRTWIVIDHAFSCIFKMISKPSHVLEPNCIETVLLRLIYQRYHTKYHTGNTLCIRKTCLVPCLCSFW